MIDRHPDEAAAGLVRARNRADDAARDLPIAGTVAPFDAALAGDVPTMGWKASPG